MTLEAGQYQIDDIIFGSRTTVRVESFDIKSYDINTQDYQVSRSDNVRFGWDSLKPTTVEITFDIMKNFTLPPFGDGTTETWGALDTLESFVTAWKSDDIRDQWGQMKGLFYGRSDGSTRCLLGRPGQFTYESDTPKSLFIHCVGEFRRHDTLSYSTETDVDLLPSHTAVITRQSGNISSHIRVTGVGPVKNPVVTIGNQVLEIPIEVKKGESFEVSSYPWQRGAMHHTEEGSKRFKIVPSTVSKQKFFNGLMIPAKAEVPIEVTAGSALKKGQIKLHWRDAWNAV
jgi:hypothetical protein